MAEDYAPTIRIRRPARVTTDERGRTVWKETVETAQLELVSTAMLHKILQSSDDDTRTAIERVVSRKEEGVLARDPATGLFEIVTEADIQAFLKEGDTLQKTGRPPEFAREPENPDAGDELSLVSTQVLRKILRKDHTPTPVRKKTDAGGGFDPYDHG